VNLPSEQQIELRQIVHKAMLAPDDYVLELDYTDKSGCVTRRTVSPIRALDKDRFLALCLCRQEPRQFYFERCANPRLVDAHDVLMPVEMKGEENG
jgi:predicted DNA-binding transcriptional regulator YafY